MRRWLILCVVVVVAWPAVADARRGGIGRRPSLPAVNHRPYVPALSPHVYRPGLIRHSYGRGGIPPSSWPDVCSVARPGPCVPQYGYPIGQDLRLTIVASEARGKAAGVDDIAAAAPESAGVEAARRLDTIRDLFDALRACWSPPPEDDTRSGMQMSVRFSFKSNGEIIATPRVTYKSPDASPETAELYQRAIMASLDHCTPMPLSSGLGGAIAGRPIAIRYVDDRTR